MGPIFAIIGCIFLPLITVILVVWFKSAEKHKRYQLQAELYAKAIEQGKPVPTDLFVFPKKRRYSLHAGLICIAAGIGIALAMWMMSVISSSLVSSADNPLSGAFEPMISIGFQYRSRFILSFGALGIIPFLIGVAFIIIHFIEKEQGQNENAQ